MGGGEGGDGPRGGEGIRERAGAALFTRPNRGANAHLRARAPEEGVVVDGSRTLDHAQVDGVVPGQNVLGGNGGGGGRREGRVGRVGREKRKGGEGWRSKRPGAVSAREGSVGMERPSRTEEPNGLGGFVR